MASQAKAGDGVLRPSFERTDERGTFVELLNSGRWESVVWGEMRAGAVLGHHYHKQTDVYFVLTQGRAAVSCEDVRSGARRALTLQARDGVLFAPYESHAVRFEEPSSFIMLKSRQYDQANPDTFPHPIADVR